LIKHTVIPQYCCGIGRVGYNNKFIDCLPYILNREYPNISCEEFYLNQSKYKHRKISITQFLESYINLKRVYEEYLHYKYTLLKQKDILNIVFEPIHLKDI